MRLSILSLSVLSLLALPLLAGCHEKTQGDAVRDAYENKARQIDRQARQQPTRIAKDIYHDQADAYREEGKDRKKGLEGKSPSSGPKPPPGQPARQGH